MLEFLKIQNLALLDAAEMDFREGFTVLTGETGAGKSVLLGALSMLAGNRCGKEIVKAGKEFCSAQAVLNFKDPSEINAFLAAEELPLCEDGALVLRRQIYAQKAAKCSINGAVSTTQTLQKLGELWIDFHGPGEPQKLFSTKNQLYMLDAYANLDSIKRDYLELLNLRNLSLKKIDELKNAKRMSPDEIDFVRTQILAIEKLNPTEESISELEDVFKLSEHSREVAEKSAAISLMISGDDGIADLLASANRLSHEISTASQTACALSERIDAAVIELGDIASEFESLANSCSFSQEEILDIRASMDSWLNLRRKYGASVAAVLKAKDDMLARIALQGDVGKAISQEEAEIARTQSAMMPLAKSIFKFRKNAAVNLEKEVSNLLKKIGFKKPEFKIVLSELAEFSASCGSVCEFEFSANPGQAPLALAKVASSGELARVMLALKTVMANADSTPLLVFDEVDANVGGEIGAEVGNELANLSSAHQVFCVTHLPQVAAFANSHLLVEKIQTDTSTYVEIKELSPCGKDRISELARMLGDRNSPSALRHASELLSAKKSQG